MHRSRRAEPVAALVVTLNSSKQRPVAKDFNADGFADLIWENTIGGQRSIWLLNRGVPSTVINLPTIPISWRIAGVGDFDGDGFADLVWENRNGQHIIWLLEGGVPTGTINLPTIPSWKIVDH